jgi:hypothetical protein
LPGKERGHPACPYSTTIVAKAKWTAEEVTAVRYRGHQVSRGHGPTHPELAIYASFRIKDTLALVRPQSFDILITGLMACFLS